LHHSFLPGNMVSSSLSWEAGMRKILFFLCIALTSFSVAEHKTPITQYEVFFSPNDHIADKLIEKIDQEKKSIRAAVFTFMHSGIATALIKAQKRGVDIELIIDPFSVKIRSPLKRLATAGIPIYVWEFFLEKKPTRGHPLMHDKFCVFGNKRVWTGSFNFTFEATNYNRENVIVVDNAAIADLYLAEFEAIKRDECVPYAEYVARKK